ncbi:UNVERIFIED_CONTAM: hypothetical protein Scaly_2512800 [Sesamum calycinum]|uniref:RAB6-interacting golgin n=1 Tax=Sesamum calycinum TaxID=2727403 RepID=A0AAW2LUM6_9LAMI
MLEQGYNYNIVKFKKMKKSLAASIGSSGRLSADDEEEDEASKMAIASYQAREEEIERRKMEELEVFTDPMRKDVSSVRKRLDMASRDLKSLQQICQKKEKEYKEAMEAFQEKSKEKAQLTTALMELVNQSENFRMKKLEELSKILNLKA